MTIANLHIWHFLHIVTEVTCKTSGWIFSFIGNSVKKVCRQKKKKSRAQNIKCKCVKVHRFVLLMLHSSHALQRQVFFVRKGIFGSNQMLLKPSKNGFNHELGKLPLSYFTPTRSLEGCSHGVAAPSYYGCLTQQIIKRKSRQTPKQTRLNWRQVNNLCCLCRRRDASVLTMKSPVGPSKTRRGPGMEACQTRRMSLRRKREKKRAFARLMRFEPSHTFP